MTEPTFTQRLAQAVILRAVCDNDRSFFVYPTSPDLQFWADAVGANPAAISEAALEAIRSGPHLNYQHRLRRAGHTQARPR